MKYLKTVASRIEHTLVLYGGWGLLGVATLDAAGLSMPGVKDFLLIYLSSKDPHRAWIYASGTILGTVVGSLFIYYVGRTGARLFKRKPSDREMGRAKKWLMKNDFLTLLVASLLPPPLPFKPILLGAGALRISRARFVAALVVGGILRFGAEAWIGVRYGVSGEEFLQHNILWISLGLVAFVVLSTVLYRWWKSEDNHGHPSAPQSVSSRPNQD